MEEGRHLLIHTLTRRGANSGVSILRISDPKCRDNVNFFAKMSAQRDSKHGEDHLNR